MHYLIIGNSAGGTAAVKGIRTLDTTGSITMIGRDSAPFSRPQLPMVAAGMKAADHATFTKVNWAEDNKVELRCRETVTQIDTAKKSVTLLGGDTLGYDKLLLATGSRTSFPPIEGLQGNHTFGLKKLEDAKAIYSYLPAVKKVAIIGGGLIGIELAAYLASLGKDATVVELAPHPLALQLEETTGAMLVDLMAQHNVKTICGDCVVAVERHDDGAPVGLALQSGRLVEADLVVCAAGVRKNIELATTGSVPCVRGIVIDKQCKTGVTDVFAAGDATEIHDEAVHPAMSNGIWAVAVKMGFTAGIAMAGGDAWLDGDTGLRIMAKLFDTTIVSIGPVHKIDPAWEKRIDTSGEGTEVFYTEGGILKAAILYGNTARSSACLKAVSAGVAL